MPRKQAHCARGVGHPPPCASPEAMERQRQRAAERARVHGRHSSPVVKSRWFKAYKLARYGLTQEDFDGFDVRHRPRVRLATMTMYDETFTAPIA